MFLRKIKHSLYLKLMAFAVKFNPEASHMTFAGSGSSAQLCRHIARTGYSKVLVVTDKPLRELGVVERAVSALVEAGVDVAYYD
ncbi:MAG: iron-containing alcohol dehydrogenase, partial [Halioglobus sp.]